LFSKDLKIHQVSEITSNYM